MADRPRRSGRASHAPDLGYPLPTVHASASPSPSLGAQPVASPAYAASSSRPPYGYGGAGGTASGSGRLGPPDVQRAPAQQFPGVPSVPGFAQPRLNGAHPFGPAAGVASPSVHLMGYPHAGPAMAASSTLSSFPLGRTSMPVPPQLAVGPGQARFTTFASRAKLGVSTLMQPLPQAQDFNDPLRGGVDYGLSERVRSGATRRRAAAGRRYYGEDLSDFDDDDESNSTPASPSKANTPLEREEEEEPQQPGALLGLPPPGNKVFAKRAHRVHPIAPSEADLQEQAEQREFLIPIKIELETDGHRIRDSFSWNIREQIVKPREFAKVYVRDLDLPADPYVGLVESAIVEQVNLVKESEIHLVDIGPATGGPFASMRDGTKRNRETRNWDWGIKRARKDFAGDHAREQKSGENKQKKIAGLTNGHGNHSGDVEKASDDTDVKGDFEDDLRVIVDYDVQIYRHHLRDRMEWDLCSPLTPEAFAAQMCKDLCLSGEAMPIIANAVREQLLNHIRSVVDLDLIGKGFEFARWQREIDDAEREMAENDQRHAKNLPSLPPKPLQHMIEEADEEPEVLGPRRRRGGAGDDGTPSAMDFDGSGTATPMAGGPANPSKNVILRTPEQRKSIAEYFQFQLTEKGPRKLEGVWREYQESREFGPLLELLSDADLERLEAEAIRASRRGRREQQRSAGRSRRR